MKVSTASKYFGKCNDIDEAHGLWRTLSKKFHPDLGGNPADFRDMTDDFQSFQKYLLNQEAAMM